MKQAILTLLARLTNAMKAESRSFHVSFLPIIQSAIEPESETQVYLLEDALDLWASIVAQTPSAPEPTPQELLNLLRYLLPLYSMDNETLRKAIEITEAYLLLAPAAVLADNFRPALLQALGELLGNLKPEANGVLTNLVQCVIRGAEGVGGEEGSEVGRRHEGLRLGHDAGQVTGERGLLGGGEKGEDGFGRGLGQVLEREVEEMAAG